MHGRVTAHHRRPGSVLLELHLGQIDALRAAVQKLEQQADEVLRPFREAAERLTTIPGVSETVARVGQIDALRAAVQKWSSRPTRCCALFGRAADPRGRPSRGCSSPRSAWT